MGEGEHLGPEAREEHAEPDDRLERALDRINALRVYLAKFADVKALFEAPKSNDEQTIAERLKAANMYRLEPCWIRLIDNSKWFGYKLEVEL